MENMYTICGHEFSWHELPRRVRECVPYWSSLEPRVGIREFCKGMQAKCALVCNVVCNMECQLGGASRQHRISVGPVHLVRSLEAGRQKAREAALFWHMLVHECCAAVIISRPKTHRECSADSSSEDSMNDAGAAAGLCGRRRRVAAACCRRGGDTGQVTDAVCENAGKA